MAHEKTWSCINPRCPGHATFKDQSEATTPEDWAFREAEKIEDQLGFRTMTEDVEIIAAALRKARADALEEAAHLINTDLRMLLWQRGALAKAIRALAERGGA